MACNEKEDDLRNEKSARIEKRGLSATVGLVAAVIWMSEAGGLGLAVLSALAASSRASPAAGPK